MVSTGVKISAVLATLVVAAGLGTLIWWLVTRNDEAPTYEAPRYETISLEGSGFGGVAHRAAFTRIPDGGDIFWWLYPALTNAAARPVLLWLDGVTGLPPSLLANFGMFGPFNFDLQRRENSWIDEFNLLFVDAPLGSGFSAALNNTVIPTDTDENAAHLLLMLESFYEHSPEFANAPLYIIGQGYGAQLAASLALALNDAEHIAADLRGVVLGNPIISPALVLTQLGLYLEELAYVDGNGRRAIDDFAQTNYNIANQGQLGSAFDSFLNLGNFVNDNAGAIAVNLNHIVEKLYNNTATSRDIFGQKQYLRDVTGLNVDPETFMVNTVAPALGISDASFNSNQENVLQSFRNTFMAPAVDKIGRILSETNINVTIYNGNLDAISNTPGQLNWVSDISWPGQIDFLNAPRQTLVVNSLVQGYFRESDRLTFYWVNAAGLSVPLDSPDAMRRILQRITAV